MAKIKIKLDVKKIPELQELTSLTGTESMYIVDDNGSNKQVKPNTIALFIGNMAGQVTKVYVDNADAALGLRIDNLPVPDVTKLYVDNADALKLNISDYNPLFVGKYTTLVALQAANPTATEGQYGQVDAGAGSNVINYNWDTNEGWVQGSTIGPSIASTDDLPEGSTNLYFTSTRAIAAVDISGKVDKVAGKGLSTEDFTSLEKTKLSNALTSVAVDGTTVTGDGTPASPLAAITAIGGVASVTGLDTDNTDAANPIVKLKVDETTITGSGTVADPLVGTPTDISGKVDKVAGKGLSEEDYSTLEKDKLSGIEYGAEVNDPNTTLQGNTFNGSGQLVQMDGAKLPAVDGSQLTNLPSSGGGTEATSAELNTGTDDAKFATALALENSKYLNQSGNKISATASGTNTYAATISPAITAYVATQRFFIRFTNANTGAATLELNLLGAKSITKNGASALVAGDIPAGAVVCIAYDGTNLQIVGAINQLPIVTSGEKAVTVKPDGPHADYDVINANAATGTSGSDLEGQTWTAGSGVTYTGLAGETRYWNNWKYECRTDNNWWRTPYNMVVSDFIIGNVDDSAGKKTASEIVGLYPSAVSPQIVTGTAGIYQYFGLSLSWFYFENKI